MKTGMTGMKKSGFPFGVQEGANPMEFSRKAKEQQPVLAVCYDFDKTLTPDDMSALTACSDAESKGSRCPD